MQPKGSGRAFWAEGTVAAKARSLEALVPSGSFSAAEEREGQRGTHLFLLQKDRSIIHVHPGCRGGTPLPLFPPLGLSLPICTQGRWSLSSAQLIISELSSPREVLVFPLSEVPAFAKSLKFHCVKFHWTQMGEVQRGRALPPASFSSHTWEAALHAGRSPGSRARCRHVPCDLELAIDLSEPQPLPPQCAWQHLPHGIIVGVQGEPHETPRAMPSTAPA